MGRLQMETTMAVLGDRHRYGNRSMEEPRISRHALFRRTVFVAILLVASTATSIYSGCFHYKWGHPRSSILGGYQHVVVEFGATLVGLPGLPASEMFNYFAWGLTTLGSILAVWLIARRNLWQTVPGRLRALTYLGFFLLGGAIGDSAQRLIHQLKPDGYPPGGLGFSRPLRWPIDIDRMPGTRLDDYSLVLAESLTIASIVWVLFPLWVGLRFRLTEAERSPYRKPTFSIATILLWTSAFGCLLGFTQVLTWWAAPSSYLSNYSGSEAISDFILLRIPSAFVTGCCGLAIAYAWSLRWFQHLALLCLAIFADGMGHHFVYSSLTAFFAVPVPRYDAFTSPPLLYWSYILGRGFVAWNAFGVAFRFGVRLEIPLLTATPVTSKEAITTGCNGGREPSELAMESPSRVPADP